MDQLGHPEQLRLYKWNRNMFCGVQISGGLEDGWTEEFDEPLLSHELNHERTQVNIAYRENKPGVTHTHATKCTLDFIANQFLVIFLLLLFRSGFNKNSYFLTLSALY